MIRLYYSIENLVLWTRSEMMGRVVNPCRGMMEHRNDGIMGAAECGLNLNMDGPDQKIKSDHHPHLVPHIPFFHPSIIPLFREDPKHTPMG